MRFTIFLVSLFCVFLTYGFTNQSIAQRAIGLHWDVPGNREKAISQLDTLKELNISYLELSGDPEAEIWDKINQLGFQVYGQIPITFPLVQTFADPDSSLLHTINSFVNRYSSQSSVRAIGLFSYGAVYESAFDTTIQSIIRQIRNSYSGNLYYTTTKSEQASVDRLFDFKVLEINVGANEHYSIPDSISDKTGGYTYLPDEDVNSFLEPFKGFLQKISGHSVPVFVESEWLFEMLQKNPGFANTIKLYNSDSEFIFPTPKEEHYHTGTLNHSLIVLLLLLIWVMFVVNYHMSPVYRKSLPRYFLGHIFFVQDVMNRHIRSLGPATTILIQNILLAGICFYSLASVLFSPLGLEAIFYHYPDLSIFKNPLLSSFLWGCILGMLLTLASIIWLKISNRAIRKLRQVVNLYAWPLQINFVIATLMVALLMAGSYPGVIFSLALLFTGIHISAFVIAAIDTSKYLNRLKVLFLIGSVGIYCVIWVYLGIRILSSSFPQVIQLALSLS